MPKNILLERVITARPALREQARPVSYIHGDRFGEHESLITDILFPNTGMISVVARLPNGDLVESAMVGHHGAVGLGAVFGSLNYINTNIALIPGEGVLIEIADVRAAVEADASLAASLFRHEQYLLAQAQQAAACNAKHQIGARLASWLCRARETTGSDELLLTQDFIAQMLGVQRATVSVVAASFQDDGLISYRRGKVRILDRHGLEGKSCGCHRVIQHQQHWLMDDTIQKSNLVAQG